MAMMCYKGMFLPEIPISEHPGYVFHVIMHTSDTSYTLYMFNEEVRFTLVDHYDNITQERYTYTYTRGIGRTEWTPANNGELTSESVKIDTNSGYDYNYNKIFWTNHNLYDSVYMQTITYPKDHDPILASVCDSEPTITLSTGVTLPGIPSNVLKQYPYAVMFGPLTNYDDNGNKRDTVYVLKANTVGYAFVPTDVYTWGDYIYGINGPYNDNVTTYILSVYNHSTGYCGTDYWCDQTDYKRTYEKDDMFTACWNEVDASICWSNHDIMIATNYDRDAVPVVTIGTEIYFKATHDGPDIGGGSTSVDKNKFLGVAGLERLIANTRSLIDAVLPTGGTAGQVLTIGEDGNPVWADAPSGGASLPAAEEVVFG